MSEETDPRYKSPKHKLIRFFEKSRDQWKAKCQTAKVTVKRLENRVRFLEKSKAHWKARAQALAAENARLKAGVMKIRHFGNFFLRKTLLHSISQNMTLS